MRFSLYIYGLFNGLLKVAIEENGTNAALLVWERHGQWTDDWEVVALELTGLQHGYVVGKTDICVQEQGNNPLYSSAIPFFQVLFLKLKRNNKEKPVVK